MTTNTNLVTIRINHPYRYANTGEVLDLPKPEADRLLQQGARLVDGDLVKHVGGGWYDVELHNPLRHARIHGKDRAVRAVRTNTDDL